MAVAEQQTELRPQAWKSEEDGEFVVFDGIPLFDEHVGPDGTQYTPELLERIAENCNRRIRATGDFTPVVVGHTSSGDEPPRDPPVIGLAGPYTLGTIDRENPRACILGKFWVFKDCLDQFKKNPRRSVEVWPEDKPENRYFDPIAVLGAETPKRDLGLIYSKPRNGVTPHRYSMKYSAAVGGATATFAPKFGAQDKNSKGQPSMALSPDDLGQIVEALKPVIQSMIDQSTIGDLGADVEPEPDDGGITVQGDEPDPMDDPMGGMPPGMPPGADPMGDPMADPMGGEGLDDLGAPPQDPTKAMKPGMPQLYQEHCDPEQYEKDAEEGSMADGAGFPGNQEDQFRYSKRATMNAAEKYRKQRDDVRVKYRKLESAYQSLRQKYAKIEGAYNQARREQRRAMRYSRLADLRNEGYVIDVQDELDDTESLSNDAFERHCGKIRMFYQKAPIGDTLPIDRDPQTLLDEQRRAAYSKQAAEVVQRYRKDGKKVDYAKVLENIVKNKGQYRPEDNGAVRAA